MSAEPANPHVEELLLHADWIRALARRLVTDADAAEELVQQTWLAVLRRPPAMGDSPRPWLARVVANFAREKRRKGAHRMAREESAAANEALPSAEELVQSAEEGRRLVEEVLALREPLRQRVLERWFEGREPAEIARLRGVPAGTVRWQLKQAVDELRERLDRRHGERATWLAALAPLCRETKPELVPASSTLLTSGVLLMNVYAKLAMTAAAIALLGVGLWQLDLLPGLRPPPPAQSVSPVYRPIVAATVDAREAQTPSAAESPVRAAAPVGPSSPALDTSASAAPLVARVRARILDEAGRPLAFARLVVVEQPELEALASASGEVELVLPAPSEDSGVEESVVAVEARARGYSRVARDVSPRAGETVWIPDFQLLLAGAIAGRVVDPEGRPIEDALVAAVDSSLKGFSNMLGNPSTQRTAAGVVLDVGQFYMGLDEAPLARTEVDGSFALEAVVAGRVRLAAIAEGRLVVFTEPFAVRVGEQCADLELVLAELPLDTRIEGRVVAADGQPLALAEGALRPLVLLLLDGGQRTFATNGAGRFALVVDPAEVVRLSATHEGGSSPEVEARGGDLDVVLRMVAPSRVELVVTASDGAPVEDFSAALIEDHLLLERVTELTPIPRGPGRAELALPSVEQPLQIAAPGFARKVLAPFAAGELPERIEVVLERLPRVHGSIRAGGRPVAGAQVSLLRPATVNATHDGFPLRFDPNVADESTVREDGSFELAPLDPGAHVVFASAEGFADREVALEIALGGEDVELVLELDSGGALEGRVRSASGASVAGHLVAASRGDLNARTQRADDAGFYRFDALAPGPWQVSLVEEDTDRWASSRGVWRFGKSTPEPLPSNCAVLAHETTHFDLWLDGAPDLRRLAGELALDGEPAAGWTVLVFEGGFDKNAGGSSTGPDGRFVFELDAPGEHRLVLMPPPGAELACALHDVVALADESTTWSLAFDTGELAGTLSPRWRDPSSGPPLVGLWIGPGRARALIELPFDESGAFRLRVPAGRVVLVPFVEEVLRDEDALVPLGEVEVPRGGTAHIDL